MSELLKRIRWLTRCAYSQSDTAIRDIENGYVKHDADLTIIEERLTEALGLVKRAKAIS